MIIHSPKTLVPFRGAGPCGWCGKACAKREAAHVVAKGMGGGSCLDIRINLIALGLGPWAGRWAECHCHHNHHDGKQPSRGDLVVAIAAREGVYPEDIEAVVNLLLRIDNKSSKDAIESAIVTELYSTESQRVLCRSTLKEHGRL